MAKQEVHNNCPTCAKVCEDAKNKVKQLEKTLRTMTIVMSVSLTLAGEQIIKNAASYISSFKSVVSSANELSKEQFDDSKKEKKENKDNTQSNAFFPNQQFNRKNQKSIVKDDKTKPYELTDELSRFQDEQKPKEPDVVEQISVEKPNDLAKFIVQSAISKELPLTTSNLDMHSFFLTPSSLPFDIQETTIALGNNYGLGQYYGIDTGYYPTIGSQNTVPASGTLMVFGMSHLLTTRKRV